MIQRAPINPIFLSSLNPLKRSISLLTLSKMNLRCQVWNCWLEEITTVICFVREKKGVYGLYLLGSHLGWILSGRLPTEEKKTSEVSMFLMTGNFSQQYQQSFVAPLENINDFVKPNLDEFWKLETIRIKEPMNDCDDDQAIQNFHDTVRKTNGPHEVT